MSEGFRVVPTLTFQEDFERFEEHIVQRELDSLKNAYRVLLTRGRQGMVIAVPHGDPEDPTRKAEFYDGTFEYLKGLGLPVI